MLEKKSEYLNINDGRYGWTSTREYNGNDRTSAATLTFYIQ